MAVDGLLDWVPVLAGAVIVLETAVSLAVIRRRGGPSAVGVLCNAVAGVALIGAVMLALAGAAPGPLLAAFAVAGLAHAGETWARWTGRDR